MKKIAVVSGGRSDRGLLDVLMEEMKEVGIEVTLIATGQSTTGDIIVPTMLADDSDDSVAVSFGITVTRMVDAYNRASPECVVVLGDRWEILAACCAAHLKRIPIAHLHGGEITLGSLDDKMRNAITAMSDIHFPTTYLHAKRVRHLANENIKVYNVGAVGTDDWPPMHQKGKQEANGWANYDDVEHPFIIVSVPEGTAEVCQAIADALEVVAPTQYIWVGPNADAGRDKLKPYSTCECMERQLFISYLTVADVIVGNSSCGLLEAYTRGTMAVNVGDRQKGRHKPYPDGVIDCPVDKDEIVKAVYKALDTKIERTSKYVEPRVSKKIATILCEL